MQQTLGRIHVPHTYRGKTYKGIPLEANPSQAGIWRQVYLLNPHTVFREYSENIKRDIRRKFLEDPTYIKTILNKINDYQKTSLNNKENIEESSSIIDNINKNDFSKIFNQYVAENDTDENVKKYFDALENYSPSAKLRSIPLIKGYRSLKKGFKKTTRGIIDRFRGHKGGTKKRKHKRKNTLKNRLKYRHF